MANEVVAQRPAELVASAGRMSVQQVLGHVSAVQEVMRGVMKRDVHYGVVPGTDKPTLFQPGADVLCMAFHIAPQFSVEDLSNGDVVRYRVTCTGVHQMTGVVMGQGVGECSGGEEKYKWRRAVCKEEFEATPANLRRVKYGRKASGHYTVEQVRTEPDDAANTVLKMANKRAKVAMVLNVLAVSDMFAQDLEDLSAAMRDAVAGEPGVQAEPAAPAVWPAEAFNKQLVRWTLAIENGARTADQIISFALTKGLLSDEQRAQILAIKPKPKTAEADPPATKPAAEAEATEPPWEGTAEGGAAPDAGADAAGGDFAADYAAAEKGDE